MDAELRRLTQKIKSTGRVVPLITALLEDAMLDTGEGWAIYTAVDAAQRRKSLTTYLWAQSPNAHSQGGKLHQWWQSLEGQDVYLTLCGLATPSHLRWLQDNAEPPEAHEAFNSTCLNCHHRTRPRILRRTGG